MSTMGMLARGMVALVNLVLFGGLVWLGQNPIRFHGPAPESDPQYFLIALYPLVNLMGLTLFFSTTGIGKYVRYLAVALNGGLLVFGLLLFLITPFTTRSGVDLVGVLALFFLPGVTFLALRLSWRSREQALEYGPGFGWSKKKRNHDIDVE